MNTKIKNILTHKNTVWFLFAFAVLLYSYQVCTTSRIGSDDIVQLSTVAHFIDGDGFVVQSADDLNVIKSEKLLSWPYFYRLVAVPVMFITGSNVELTSLMLTIIAFAFLLLSIGYFIKNINLDKKKIILGLIFLFSAINTAPIKSMGSSDLFALGFSLLAIIFLLKVFNENEKLKYTLLFFCTVALLPQIRYAYVPVSMGFMVLYFIVLFINKLSFSKKWLSLFVVIPIISLFYVITNPYFLGTSERYTATSVSPILEAPETISWLKLFYAPFFNSFFPDYILVSFGQKFPMIWEKIVIPVFAVFAILSMVILVFVFLHYFKKTKNIASLFTKEKLPETSLMVLAFSTLALYLIIYRNMGYSKSQLLSPVVLYEKLAVVNRYFGPIHIASYLLAIMYIVKYNSRFFKLLIFASVLFGFSHFVYLRTVYHPFSRTTNMDIVNNPPGSYYDNQNIGKIIKESRAHKTVFYTSEITNAKGNVNYRQMSPNLFAMANGAVMLSADARLDAFDANKHHVYRSDFNTTEIDSDIWELVYSGNIYSLWEYQPK